MMVCQLAVIAAVLVRPAAVVTLVVVTVAVLARPTAVMAPPWMFCPLAVLVRPTAVKGYLLDGLPIGCRSHSAHTADGRDDSGGSRPSRRKLEDKA